MSRTLRADMEEETRESVAAGEDSAAELLRAEEAASFDAVLEEVGGWGRYQKRVWLCFTLGLDAVNMMQCIFMMFGGAAPKRFCPSGNATLSHNATACPESCPVEWEFEEEVWSMGTEFGLYCSRSGGGEAIAAVQMSGIAVGALFWGQVAEVFGRKKVLLCIYSGVLAMGFLTALAPTWELLAVALFLLGTFNGGFSCVNLVVALEAVESSKRLFVVCTNGIPAAYIGLALLTWALPHWRRVLFLINGVGVFGLLFFLWLEESARWLLQHGRREEAERALRRMAAVNGRRLPDQLRLPAAVARKRKLYTYRHLFRNPTMAKHTLALAYSWFVMAAVNFGLSFNVKNLPGNRFVNALGVGVSYAVFVWAIPLMSRWWGRRQIHQASLGATGLCCGLAFALQASGTALPGGEAALALLSILGASLIGPTWCVAFLYSAELFPTVVRNLAAGLCSVAARIGGVVGPLMLLLREVWPPAAFLVFASLTFLNLLIAFVALPETKDAPLPDILPAKQSVISLRRFSSKGKSEPAILIDVETIGKGLSGNQQPM